MIANSEFHTFILVAAGFTLFCVKIGATKDPGKQLLLKMNLIVFGLVLLYLGLAFLNQFNFVISFQTIVFWGFLVEAIIAFILSVNVNIPKGNEDE